MSRFHWLSLLFFLSVGCASARAAQPPARSSVPAAEPGPGHARTQGQLSRRVSELEARIALLEAEARRVRAVEAVSVKPLQTVRIGATRAAAVEEEAGAAVGDEGPRRERVPTLRLRGRSIEAEAQASTDADLASLPALEVVPLPHERVAPPADGAKEVYRDGLLRLRERDYDGALVALSDLLSRFPGDALEPDALYWRGEARYAKREYQRAREDFESVLSRFPQGARAADATLKVGLCLRRLGAQDEATEYFRRVREKYPGSQAAVIASREGST